MTSKNSFWASLTENNKRRIWLWILSVLVFVIAFPAGVAMSISRVKTNGAYLLESLGETLGREALHQQLTERMEWCFGAENYLLLAAVCILAVISAIQGFGYLYSRKKIDFYLGMPVKKNRRFVTIWLNGVLIFLLPVFAGTLLGWLVAAGNGLFTAAIFKGSALALGLMLCVYLSVYHLAILAVMMTGNVIITCFGTALFCTYECLVRVLLAGYGSMFYKTYILRDAASMPLFSPFAIYVKYLRGQNSAPVTVLLLLGFAAVIGLAAYLCYRKHPAEAAGKAVVFKAPQPVIKILIAVPAALMAGYFAADIVGYAPIYREGSVGLVLFSMVIVLLVVCCLIQVIYEFDIKGIFHKKRHIVLSGAAVAAVFLIFRYDVFGYDRYLPKAEKVTSAAIITPYEFSYYGNGYFDEELDYVSKSDFVQDHMYLTDIGAVNKLLKSSNDMLAEHDSMDFYTDGEWYSLEIVYRMGCKRTVSRRAYVNMDDPETMELLDRTMGSEEYIDGAYVSAAEMVDHALANEKDKVTAYYGTNIYNEKMTREEARQFLALYKEDVRELRFSKMRSSIPAGSLILNVERKYQNYTTYRDAEFQIYPFYSRCVAYLKDKGIYRDYFLDPEDVEKIQVTNYNYKRQQEEQADDAGNIFYDAEALLAIGASAESVADTTEFIRSAVYDKEEEIRELCDQLYPDGWIHGGWNMDAAAEGDYLVTVYFKPEKSVDGMGVAGFVFLNGEVPEFVVEDTSY